MGIKEINNVPIPENNKDLDTTLEDSPEKQRCAISCSKSIKRRGIKIQAVRFPENPLKRLES